MSGAVALAGLVAAALLAAAGLGIAGYLTSVHYADEPIACTGLGDCEYVNSSEYAKVAGVPVALLGAVAYATLLGGAALTALRRDPVLLLATWGLGLATFAFSMYLTYIELWVLEAICTWCVASASVATALFVALSVSVWAVRRDVIWDDAAAMTSQSG